MKKIFLIAIIGAISLMAETETTPQMDKIKEQKQSRIHQETMTQEKTQTQTQTKTQTKSQIREKVNQMSKEMSKNKTTMHQQMGKKQ